MQTVYLTSVIKKGAVFPSADEDERHKSLSTNFNSVIQFKTTNTIIFNIYYIYEICFAYNFF